jgi:hypothetical protein
VGEGEMNPINDDLWKAFEKLAEQYPDDHGVRMTADLARWLKEHHQRFATDETSQPD